MQIQKGSSAIVKPGLPIDFNVDPALVLSLCTPETPVTNTNQKYISDNSKSGI